MTHTTIIFKMLITEKEMEDLYSNESPHTDLGGGIQSDATPVVYPKTLDELRASEKRYLERYNRHAGVQAANNQKGIEYMKNLYETPQIAPLTEDDIFARAMCQIGTPDAKEQEMEYEKAKRIFFSIYSELVLRSGNAVVVDGNMALVLQNMCKYFINDASCEYDLNKGVCLIGYVRCGKTMLMQAFKVFCDAANLSKSFSIVDCDDMVNAERLGSPIEIVGSTMFDDLAREPQFAKHFGNDISVMEEAIIRSEKSHVQSGTIFHFTTNDMPDQLEKYGTRAYRRLCGMVTFVVMKGDPKSGTLNIVKH